MKITLIVNGRLPGRKELYRRLPRLEADLPGAHLVTVESDHSGHAIALAAEHAGSSDYLIAAGGDGTLNEVLNGSMRARQEDPAVVLPVYGTIALGTANDFARTLGLAGTVEELMQLVQSRTSRRIDIGRLRCHDAGGRPLERYFFNVADAGIGASVVQHLGASRGYLGSNLTYLRAILSTFLSYRHMKLQLESEAGLEWRGRSLAVVAANGCYFGSGLCVAPGARVDDGQLFLTVVGDANVADFLANLVKLKRGLPLDHPKVNYHAATSVTVETKGPVAPVEADGEFLGYTPAVIEIQPGALLFLAPRS